MCVIIGLKLTVVAKLWAVLSSHWPPLLTLTFIGSCGLLIRIVPASSKIEDLYNIMSGQFCRCQINIWFEQTFFSIPYISYTQHNGEMRTNGHLLTRWNSGWARWSYICSDVYHIIIFLITSPTVSLLIVNHSFYRSVSSLIQELASGFLQPRREVLLTWLCTELSASD